MKIAVLGAGYGGLHLVQQLARQNFAVTLLEPHLDHVLKPRLVSVATLRRPLQEALLPYAKLLPPTVTWLREPAVALDTLSGQIETDRTSLQADRIILALGSVPQLRVPGADKQGFCVYSSEAIPPILSHWNQLQRDLEAQRCDPNLLRWVVVGGGHTGVELAAELVHLARRWRNRYGGVAGAIQIHLIQDTEDLLPGWPLGLVDWVRRWLLRHRVQVQTSTRVRRARPDYLVLESGTTTSELPTRTVFWATGERPQRLEEEPEGLRDDHGYIPVDKTCQVETNGSTSKIFALGGQIQVPDLRTGRLLPASGQLAVQTAQVLVRNLVAEREGKPLIPLIPDPPQLALSVGAFDGAAFFQGQELTGTPGWTVAQAADTFYYNLVTNWNLPLPTLSLTP